MIKLKTISAKNFLSIGNQTQAVTLESDNITLVLGENLDLGGNDSGSRNGVGKSTILNAISYAIYGNALTNIKKENLINKVNGKNMIVTLEFSVDNIEYRIERGRKPNVLKVYQNDVQRTTSIETEDSQGDSRETQKYIDSIIKMSHTMFKNLVGLNTYSEPFLAMRSADQREIIEQLLGITALSEKAEILKLDMKETKDCLQSEAFKIESIKTANENVQKSINSLKLRSSAWSDSRLTNIKNINLTIDELNNLNIEEEIKNHNLTLEIQKNKAELKNLENNKKRIVTNIQSILSKIDSYKSNLTQLDNNTCPCCEQKINNDIHVKMKSDLTDKINNSNIELSENELLLAEIENKISSIDQVDEPTLFYNTIEDAVNHRSTLIALTEKLAHLESETNPYLEQIEELQKTALQEITWDKINELNALKEHQDILYKLLTNKDSFIRKKIIDQNLSYLNTRLDHYITNLGLPHKVEFQNDLSVSITMYGEDLDFDNLSRGERNRLILSLSFAFRDVWENLYHPINLLFIDELIDSGMDPAGVESGLSVLKKMARERNKNIFLISHKDELISRVNTVLKVIKESGFTSYESTEYFE